MKTSNDVSKRILFAITLMAVATIGFAAVTPAFAMTPGLIVSDVTENGIANLNFKTTHAVTHVDAIAVWSTSVGVPSDGCTSGGVGGLPTPGGVGEKKWILRDSTDAIAQIDVTGTDVIVSTPFGGGSITPSGAGISAPNAPFHWDDVDTGADNIDEDTTDVGGNTPKTYSYGLCGTDGDSEGQQAGGGTGNAFKIVAPVAGELIPINTTALLLAGIQANSFGILVGLVTISAAAFGGLYFQVKKSKN